MSSFALVELTPDNLPAAAALRVAPGQEGFVATVLESVAEAYVNPPAWPRVVLRDGEVVGFVMASFDPDNEIEELRAGVWRLLVGASAQRSGVGRFAVEQVADEARRRGLDRITVLWERGEGGPEGFYLRLGFEPTGVELFGEVVGALDI
ncbi:acetyltransferase [Sanguibacter keddieii DSM 10542]|uniref:Acetyltransferase n=1 Tax=Sanguibacter keddieii (strain ATCC 51767 / DSM 10542 / NCFB 3025 / ST-74) TaxID=446469 RepID=D1BCY9_SANKS|nr:GNAT family N-acetyltransferase [Sanguibacter keddieii]ACZ20987.1 acetyltransferase [Sanguibacter keddieii DSM 10542]